MKFSTTFALAAVAGAASAAYFEPPAGKLYLGVWHENGNPSADEPYNIKDSPTAVNSRLGRNVPVYQYAQDIPLGIIKETGEQNTGDLGSLEATKTDAIFFLTVYPSKTGGFNAITDADVQALANQLGNITAPNLSNRRVMLRLFPEMNGNWYPAWHGRPNRFKTEWKRIYDAVKAKGAKVDFVWSPNYGVSYPFGSPGVATAPGSANADATEYKALDTNGDNIVDGKDDAFSPFYPGDEYVDWVGLSVYWKCVLLHFSFDEDFGNLGENRPPSGGEFDNYMVAENGVNFYDVYAKAKSKPFAISESGAAFALTDLRNGRNVSVTCCNTRLEVQQAFWKQYVTNEATFTKYPQMKLVTIFEKVIDYETAEHRKLDDDIVRDFRVTATTAMSGDDSVLAAFKTDINAVADKFFVWAGSSTTGGGSSANPSTSGTNVGVSSTAASTNKPSSGTPLRVTSSNTWGAGVVAGVVSLAIFIGWII
ncbi:hypothetical protein HDU97_000819 [Phlyctochytrium planicorne]|nr:hypothetical protein HDU97_000819 [Phlyctochytrium planicorne]